MGLVAFHHAQAAWVGIPFITPVALRDVYPDRYLAEFKRVKGCALRWRNTQDGAERACRPWPPHLGLLCKNTWSCDPYYYLLGLSSGAGRRYQRSGGRLPQLWSDYSKSPYTIMARIKLLGSALLTVTPTPTYTPTITTTPLPSQRRRPLSLEHRLPAPPHPRDTYAGSECDAQPDANTDLDADVTLTLQNPNTYEHPHTTNPIKGDTMTFRKRPGAC